jgi:uncharacterized lipoprotein YbaY/heat shock protein HslJ
MAAPMAYNHHHAVGALCRAAQAKEHPMRRLWLTRLLGAALLLLPALALVRPGAAQAQTDERCFAETGFCISGRIREFWERNGGLSVFGLPLGPQQEQQIEGKPVQAQWFERNRLELHPENPRPYDVLIGRVGADRLAQQGRDWFTFPKLDPNNADAESCRYFRETDHQVCGEFLAAYRGSGLDLGQPGVSFEESLALFGLPLSEPTTEVIEGKEYQVQWFERARFELHPELRSTVRILFGRLGAEILAGGPAAGLERGEWTLVRFGPADAPQPAVAGQPATLTFAAGQLSGSTGCNRIAGGYEATATTITFGQLLVTAAACAGEELGRQEQAIITALRGPAPYAIEGDQLRISYDGGRQALVYRPTAAARPTVSGTVTYRQRSALPPNARLRVQLLDVSRADAPATVIGEQSYVTNGQQVPLPYAIGYDPAQIEERFTYVVRAEIFIDDRLAFTSTTTIPVLTRGNPSVAEIVVEPV